MSSKVVGGVYGITTQVSHIGTSLAVGFSALPGVVKTEIRQLAGASLYIGGLGVAHLSLLVAGAHLTSLSPSYYTVDGPGGFALAAGGGVTATVHLIKSLGEGFDGQY